MKKDPQIPALRRLSIDKAGELALEIEGVGQWAVLLSAQRLTLARKRRVVTTPLCWAAMGHLRHRPSCASQKIRLAMSHMGQMRNTHA
jgi:hypothetical protein